MKHLVLFRGRAGISRTRGFVLLTFLALFLLSPYLDMGGAMLNTGIIASLLFFLVFWHLFIRVVVLPSYLFLALPVAALVLYNSLLSVAGYQGPVTLFTQLGIKLMLYVAVGFVLALYFSQFAMTEEQMFELLLRLVLYVVIFNSALVLLLFLNQDLRALVESFLYSDESMNINYEMNTRRMRGIASSGGATLSVFHAMGIVISGWLYVFRKTGTFFFACSSLLIACSMLVIGRSGIVLVVASLPLLVLFAYVNSDSYHRLRAAAVVLLAALAVISLPLLAWLILPRSMFDYALGFLYGGVSGIKEEGTVAIITSFYQFPHETLQLLMGVGDYSGAFDPAASADPGFMKMGTALGIPMAAFFYGLIVLFSLWITFRENGSRFERGVILLVLASLLFAEFKEPFILEGYSARLFWLLIGFSAFSCRLYQSKRALADHCCS